LNPFAGSDRAAKLVDCCEHRSHVLSLHHSNATVGDALDQQRQLAAPTINTSNNNNPNSTTFSRTIPRFATNPQGFEAYFQSVT
jgi:hypothetical protein